MTTTKVREEIVEYLRRELVGPAPGFPAIQLNHEEMLRSQDPPRLRYSLGILFPLKSERTIQQDIAEKDIREADTDAAEEAGGVSDTDGPELPDSGNAADQQPETNYDLNLANQYLPSAMGVSALVSIPGGRLVAKVETARYEKAEIDGFGRGKSKNGSTSWAWLRKPLVRIVTFDASELLGKATVCLEKQVVTDVPDCKLMVSVVSRPHNGHASNKVRLVTVTLINRNESASTSSDELCFFQCRLEVSAEDDSGACFLEYPDHKYGEEPEERSLRFLYRNRKVFAVGHGCSSDWLEDRLGQCTRIWTESLPTFELRPIEHVDLPNLSFSMRTLSESSPEAIGLCEALANAYSDWITGQRGRTAQPSEIPGEFQDVANANLDLCESCLARMRRGIQLLREDDSVKHAFRLANQAMYMQQAHYELASSKIRHWLWRDKQLELAEPYTQPDYVAKAAAWRPFQLAFLLMNLESIAQEDSEERNIVDLIWFPTGGGKTEAYLGLSAFTIFLRRLRDPDDAGTTVLMRYTLRLLTTQQFQRAASLICACDFIRQSLQAELGKAAHINRSVGRRERHAERFPGIGYCPHASSPVTDRKPVHCIGMPLVRGRDGSRESGKQLEG